MSARASVDIAELIESIRAGDRRALARAISLVEDGTPSAAAILAGLYVANGEGVRIGITGAPGAGKSTLSSELISVIRASDLTVAVVAVDPSSPFTGGSILGDRIRMQDHIGDPGVYIRSMASRGHLGGLSAATPKVAAILEGAGFDVVLIETVGVGQAEVEIVKHADATVVVVTPGWGDSVQANKAGLLEIGDIFVVNKSDRPGAPDTVRDLEGMLNLGARTEWRPPIVETVATDGMGVARLWAVMGELRSYMEGGSLDVRRARRIESTINHAVREAVVANLSSGEIPEMTSAIEAVRNGDVDPWSAADCLVRRIGG